MPDEFVGLLIIGIVAGLASGMFGIGGGVIIVPALITFLGFTQLAANGTSIAARLVPVGIFGALAYWRAGKVQIRTAFLLALGLTVGGYFGARIANDLPQQTLKAIYGVFLLYVAWRFGEPLKLWAAWQNRGQAAAVTNAAEANAERIDVSWYWLLVLGFGAGITSGLFGIGGGVVIVPALIALLNFEQKRAVGTSLMALQFPVAIPAAIEYYNAGNLNINVAVFVGLGLIIGAFIGARVALGMPSTTVKRLYAIFLVFIGLRFLGLL